MTRRPLRIDVHVHGRGLGHASRIGPVITRLREVGHDVEVFAPANVLTRLGEPTGAARPHVARGPGASGAILARARTDARSLRARRTDVVVSDGDAPSSWAAWSLGVPRIAVGHGLLFAATRIEGAPVWAQVVEGLNALSAGAVADRWVVTHFAPARSPLPHVEFVRTDLTAGLDRTARPDGPVLAYFRDGLDGGYVEALRAHGVPVECAGDARAPMSASDFRARLERARGVVGTAGSNLCAEAACLGIPMLALARRDDLEQRLNAAIVERERIGVAADLDRLDGPRLERFAASLTGVRALARTGSATRVEDAVERAVASLAPRG